jgi:iron-only hydrogenase group A
MNSIHLSPDIRVPIDGDNPAIGRDDAKCIRCGRCRDICRDYVAVGGYYDLAATGDRAICIGCGQCANVCPTGAITGLDEVAAVKAAICDPGKIVIVSTSPSVRVGLGEAFGMARGSFVEGRMVALLRRLGADYVLDTNFAADLTIMEEANELIERLTRGGVLPQFTSCCPAWVKFAETYYPQVLPHISSVKSPIGMQGATIKTYFAKEMGIDPANIVNVAVTPCTAKKMEIRRPEMADAAGHLDRPGLRDMDHVITTRELAAWAQAEGIDFASLEEADFDRLMGQGSGAGVIFGNSGGVMEAALRTAYRTLTGNRAPDALLDFRPVRGMDGIKEAVVSISGRMLRVAVVYGTANVRRLLDRPDWKGRYQFIEVMTCPGGCIGGGGQPKKTDEEGDAPLRARTEALYKRDASLAPDQRTSDENTQIAALYDSFYGAPASPLARRLLHTAYTDRSADLGGQTYTSYQPQAQPAFSTQGLRLQDAATTAAPTPSAPAAPEAKSWRCSVCGYIAEGPQPPDECPICHVGAGRFVAVEEEAAPAAAPAPSAQAAPAVKSWRCSVCGYIAEGPQPPDECPICHVGAGRFVAVEEEAAPAPAPSAQAAPAVKSWRCSVCGYVAEGPQPPDECPICHVGAGRFEEVIHLPQQRPAQAQPVPAAPAQPVQSASPVRCWRCAVCGYVYEGPQPPAACPLCQAGPEAFEPVQQGPAKTWKCSVCGYICQGPVPPQRCPLCNVDASFFEEVTEPDPQPAGQTGPRWICSLCGYVHEGPQPPAACPLCGAGPQAFQVLDGPQPAAKETVSRWKCQVCGYIAEGPQPPDECPICRVGADRFVPYDPDAPAAPPVQWICRVCGYVHEGDQPPQICPVCHMDAEFFDRQDPQPAPGPSRRWRCSVCGCVTTGPQPPEKCPVCNVDGDFFEALE